MQINDKLIITIGKIWIALYPPTIWNSWKSKQRSPAKSDGVQNLLKITYTHAHNSLTLVAF